MTQSVKSNWLYISRFLAMEVLQQRSFMARLPTRRQHERVTLRTLKQAHRQARFMVMLVHLRLLFGQATSDVEALLKFTQAKCAKHTYPFRYVPRKSARQLLWREVHGAASRLQDRIEQVKRKGYYG